MISIAIDGPAGAGKSTIAKEVAKELGFIYVDTGALYRTVGYYILKQGENPANREEVLKRLPEIEISLCFQDGWQRVLLCGKDVSEEIRSPEVSMAASDVSAIKEVRDFLFGLQRNLARNNNILMDGRDIGTVVLPNAQIKIFLTASSRERATRRYHQLKRKGIDVTFEEVLEDIEKRDYQDSYRAVAPLVPAQDAVIVDTTGNTLKESIQYLTHLIKERLS